MRAHLRLAASLAATAAAVLATLAATPAPAAAASTSVCYTSYLQGIGWQGPRCDGQVSGTVGQGRRIEAILMAVSGTGGFCARVHVQDGGWQARECAPDGGQVLLATTGSGKRIEALGVSVHAGYVCGSGHVQDQGWQAGQCGPAITLGTTGQSRRLEAFWLTASA
jgi:uncharacterized protein YjdB